MTFSVHLLKPRLSSDSQEVGAPTIAANKVCDPGLGHFLNYHLAVDSAVIGACFLYLWAFFFLSLFLKQFYLARHPAQSAGN